jgi:insulysin
MNVSRVVWLIAILAYKNATALLPTNRHKSFLLKNQLFNRNNEIQTVQNIYLSKSKHLNSQLLRHPVSFNSSCYPDTELEWSRRDFLNAMAFTSSLSTLSPGVSDAEEFTPVKTSSNSISTSPIIPFSTQRSYRHLELSNGIKVLLVNDLTPGRMASIALTIAEAGQFQEDPNIGGLAHLMEHIVCSTRNSLEDWLQIRDGASNAFTAPDKVCFHYIVPPEYVAQSLVQFSGTLDPMEVRSACFNPAILRREIRRINEELDFRNLYDQELYLIKSLVQDNHPFARFTQGNYESLETRPTQQEINVSEKLFEFFENHYLASNAVLVLVTSFDLDTMQKWIAPFSKVLNPKQERGGNSLLQSNELDDISIQNQRKYPKPYVPTITKASQFILWHPKRDSPLSANTESLSMNWFLERSYTFPSREKPLLTSTTMAFFLSQLLDSRGPGSLFRFLMLRGWIPDGSPPRITVPVDVSSFQLLRLHLTLTLEGFANRSAVLAAIYECLQQTVSNSPLLSGSDDRCWKQYIVMARLHGYYLSPRPPDEVELAVDAQTYGLGGSHGVGIPGVWPTVPSIDDHPTIVQHMRRTLSDILKVMVDPNQAITIVTASNKAIVQSQYSLIDGAIPPLLIGNRWNRDPLTGARYLKDNMRSIYGHIEEWIANILEEDSIQPPTYNPLLPPLLRPPRQIREQISSDGIRRLYYMDPERDTIWRESITALPGSSDDFWGDRAVRLQIGNGWKLYQSTTYGLRMPQMPPEQTCRCSLMIQLLSPRTARATIEQAALAQLWMISLEDSIHDLVSHINSYDATRLILIRVSFRQNLGFLQGWLTISASISLECGFVS